MNRVISTMDSFIINISNSSDEEDEGIEKKEDDVLVLDDILLEDKILYNIKLDEEEIALCKIHKDNEIYNAKLWKLDNAISLCNCQKLVDYDLLKKHIKRNNEKMLQEMKSQYVHVPFFYKGRTLDNIIWLPIWYNSTNKQQHAFIEEYSIYWQVKDNFQENNEKKITVEWNDNLMKTVISNKDFFIMDIAYWRGNKNEKLMKSISCLKIHIDEGKMNIVDKATIKLICNFDNRCYTNFYDLLESDIHSPIFIMCSEYSEVDHLFRSNCFPWSGCLDNNAYRIYNLISVSFPKVITIEDMCPDRDIHYKTACSMCNCINIMNIIGHPTEQSNRRRRDLQQIKNDKKKKSIMQNGYCIYTCYHKEYSRYIQNIYKADEYVKQYKDCNIMINKNR